jgi:hypothetical protein
MTLVRGMVEESKAIGEPGLLPPFAPVGSGSIISPGGGDNVCRVQCSRGSYRHRGCGVHSPSTDSRALGAVETASPVRFDLIPMGP